MAEEAVTSLPDGHHDRRLWLDILTAMLTSKCIYTGAADDFQLAIFWTEKRVESSSVNGPDRRSCLASLARILSIMYARTYSRDDLQKAIVAA